MPKKISIFIFLTTFFALFFAFEVLAGGCLDRTCTGTSNCGCERYRVDPGETIIVFEHNLCQRVTNQSGYPQTFVPAKTQTEWNIFCPYRPGHITCSNCITPPPPPDIVNCQTISSSQIDILWTSVPGATYYEVYFCHDPACTSIGRIGTPSSTSYSHTGLSPNTTYSYLIRSCNAAGCGSYSWSSIATCTTYGAGPSGSLSCQSSTQTSITLSYSFSNSASGQVSLFRGSTRLTTFSGTSGSGNYTDSSLSSGTSYTYYLRDGTSASSPLLASRTCSTTSPPSPSGSLSCQSSTQTSITLSYSFSNSASGQVSLFRGSTRLTTFSGTSGSGNYTDSSLSSGTSYTYYLRDGTSASSPLLASRTCSTTSPPPPSHTLSVQSTPPTGLSIISTTGHGSPPVTNYIKTVTAGTSVNLTAPQTSGSYVFSNWSGCDSVGGTGNRTCNLTVNSNRTVTANYAILNTLYVSSRVDDVLVPGAVITWVSGTSGMGATTQYSRTVSGDINVILRAPTTHGGGNFDRWSYCDSTSNGGLDCTVSQTGGGGSGIEANYITPPCTGAYYTTNWGAGGPGCSGYNQRCYQGVCRTCGGYFYSDGCGGCSGIADSSGRVCWRVGTFAFNCTDACSSYGGCIQQNWNDSSTCTVSQSLQPVCATCVGESSVAFPGKVNPGLTNSCKYRVANIQGCSGALINVRRVCVCQY